MTTEPETWMTTTKKKTIKTINTTTNPIHDDKLDKELNQQISRSRRSNE